MIRAALLAAVLAFPVHAASGEERLRELPPLLQAVSDEVGVMSLSEGRALAKHIARVEDERGVKIIIVIVKTVRPEDIDAYTRRLLARWRAASGRLEDGRYVMVILAVEDRELRITPGPPTETLVRTLEHGPALEAVRLLLRSARYFKAVDTLVDQIDRLASPPPDTT